MDPEHMKLSGRRYKRLHTVHDSFYAISPKQANPQGQEVGWWLSGEGNEVMLMRTGFFWGDGIFRNWMEGFGAGLQVY